LKIDSTFLNNLSGNVLIASHQNADPDALGAAQGINELVQKTTQVKDIKIFFPKGISKISSKINEKLKINFYTSIPNIENNSYIIVDTGSLSQLDELSNLLLDNNSIKIFIDHHLINEEILQIADHYINYSNISSTSEIVYLLFKEKNLKPSIKTAKALLTGIIFDTKYLQIGNSSTFNVVSELLEISGLISDIIDMMNIEAEISEKIARLKAAKRIDLHIIKNWIIVTSKVGSFQSSAARGLLSLGADLAIILSDTNNKLRVSMRSSQKFYKKTGLHLGKLSIKLGELLQGSGNGHPTAAGFNGDVKIDLFLSTIIEKISEKLKKN
jgi:nanoRNase/pAp phosphatase (c-di-AMP/oligoRNAs hydrolase)